MITPPPPPPPSITITTTTTTTTKWELLWLWLHALKMLTRRCLHQAITVWVKLLVFPPKHPKRGQNVQSTPLSEILAYWTSALRSICFLRNIKPLLEDRDLGWDWEGLKGPVLKFTQVVKDCDYKKHWALAPLKIRFYSRLMTPKQISSIVYQIIPITSRPVPSRWGTRRLEGTEHLGVLKISLKRVHAFQIEL